MGSISKTGPPWRAYIRRKGFAPLSKSFERRNDAEKWLRKNEAGMDSGVHIPLAKETLRSVVKRFMEEECDTHDGGRWELIRLKAFLLHPKAVFVDKAIGHVTSEDISVWIEARRKETSNSTASRERGLLSGIFTHAMKKWHIKLATHPVRMTVAPPSTKSRNRRVSPAELGTVKMYGLSEANKFTVKWYICVMFQLAVETGLRLKELTRIQPAHVHTDEKWLYVLPSKNGDDRQVPLSLRAIELLAMADNQFPVKVGTAGTTWKRLFADLGFVNLHFHDSRHEACTMLSKIYTVLELAKIIGHRDLRSLMIYYNPTGSELASKMHAWTPPTPPRPLLPTAVS